MASATRRVIAVVRISLCVQPITSAGQRMFFSSGSRLVFMCLRLIAAKQNGALANMGYSCPDTDLTADAVGVAAPLKQPAVSI